MFLPIPSATLLLLSGLWMQRTFKTSWNQGRLCLPSLPPPVSLTESPDCSLRQCNPLLHQPHKVSSSLDQAFSSPDTVPHCTRSQFPHCADQSFCSLQVGLCWSHLSIESSPNHKSPLPALRILFPPEPSAQELCWAVIKLSPPLSYTFPNAIVTPALPPP